jgi:DNA-binding NtrC family response regulator
MTTILIVNTAPDTVELLAMYFEQHGYTVVSAYSHEIRRGETDLGAILRQHRPAVIVYDLAPPYERNWRFFLHLREELIAGYPVVFTSTNAALATKMLTPHSEVFDVIETPYELERILDAVRRALAPSSGAKGSDRSA